MGMTSGVDFVFPAGWMVDEMCVNGECQTPTDPSQWVPPQSTTTAELAGRRRPGQLLLPAERDVA